MKVKEQKITIPRIGEVEKGSKIMTTKYEYIKILAIVDGYVMARRKGCVPFVQSIKEFEKFIKPELSSVYLIRM